MVFIHNGHHIQTGHPCTYVWMSRAVVWIGNLWVRYNQKYRLLGLLVFVEQDLAGHISTVMKHFLLPFHWILLSIQMTLTLYRGISLGSLNSVFFFCLCYIEQCILFIKGKFWCDFKYIIVPVPYKGLNEYHLNELKMNVLTACFEDMWFSDVCSCSYVHHN
jgi:hypothetical protein